MTCATCKRTMRPRRTTLADYPGTVVAARPTECSSCTTRRYRGKVGPPRRSNIPVADIVEDAEFLAAHGENLPGAAKRMGYASAHSLDQALTRAGRRDILARFTRLEVA